VNFILTNTESGLTITSYSFYLSGQSAAHPSTGNPQINFYALAGAITVDQNGNLTGGEEDYNDANGYTYSDVLISNTGGTLSVNSTTGQGTLVLPTNNSALGVSGTETFAVQFVNASHALIMQWDGAATSSGSLDLQNLASAPSGGYAFTLSGVDSSYLPIGLAGVFASDGTLPDPQWPGLLDVNDGSPSIGVSLGNPFMANVTPVDAYGRGQVSGIGVSGGAPLTLTYYQVGPEALRIIDMDTTIAGLGSAFGQGTNVNGATTAGLVTSVFQIAGNPFSSDFGVLGQFAPDSSAATLSGVADDNELGSGFSATAAAISGTYTVGTNGYGSITVTSGNLGSVSKLGLYLTDPKLNLNDPNNTNGVGGALLLDLDTALPGGAGLTTPQTDTSTTSFSKNYAAGWQDLNNFKKVDCPGCELDVVAQGSVISGVINLDGLTSDPFNTLSTQSVPTGSILATPLADSASPGRYSLSPRNSTPNPLGFTVNVSPPVIDEFDVVLYQASGGQLFWLEMDANAVFLGPLEQQGSLTGIPSAGNNLLRNGLKQQDSTEEQVPTQIRRSRSIPE